MLPKPMYVSNAQLLSTFFTCQAPSLLLPPPPRQPHSLPKEAAPSLHHHPSTYSCQPSSLRHSAASLHSSSPEPRLSCSRMSILPCLPFNSLAHIQQSSFLFCPVFCSPLTTITNCCTHVMHGLLVRFLVLCGEYGLPTVRIWDRANAGCHSWNPSSFLLSLCVPLTEGYLYDRLGSVLILEIRVYICRITSSTGGTSRTAPSVGFVLI